MNTCFIDFETTGVNVFEDLPIEIGMILVDAKFQVLRSFYSRIGLGDYEIDISKESHAIHNISHRDLINAPSQREVLDKIFSEIGTNYRLAGWNISFDIPFFRKLCHSNGYMQHYNKIHHRHLDIQTINQIVNSFGLFGNQKLNSLNEVSNFFGFKRQHKHNALEDAKITHKVYLKLVERLQKNCS